MAGSNETARRRNLALALCVAVICAAAILSPVQKSRAARRKFVQAVAECRTRAERGDAAAQCWLGSASYYGSGVPQNYAEAVRWYRKCADQGVAEGQYALSYAYHTGRGAPRDDAESVRWSRKAADQGYPLAERALGLAYEYGEGAPQDYAEASRWYLKAAGHGDATAQFHLGRAYRWGQGVPQSDTEAARWFRKCAANGDLAAQIYLAHAYRSGLGVSRDSIESARWYVKAAAQAGSRCALRVGWTPFVAIALLVIAIAVPQRRWGRALGVSWALMSVGSATGLVHALSGNSCKAWFRLPSIVLLAALSAMCAVVALYAARREYRK